VSDFRNLAWTPHLLERFPYPPWLDRSLAAVAPLQPPVAPLLAWQPLLPHRLLIALRGPPSIDAWAPVFPLPTGFLAFGSRYVLTLAQDSRTLALPQEARFGNLIQDNRAVALLTRN